MSKRLDRKEMMIDFVMTAPLAEACAVVEMLGGIVKARGKQAQQMAAAKPATPAAPRKRGTTLPSREIKLVDPNAPTPLVTGDAVGPVETGGKLGDQPAAV